MADPPKKSDSRSAELYRWLRLLGPPKSLDQLGERLEYARTLYWQRGTAVRYGTIAALGSVIAYLKLALNEETNYSSPASIERLLFPLDRLLHGLEDLEIGLVATPLHPQVKRSGGTKLGLDEVEVRLLVCVALDTLERFPLDVDHAIAADGWRSIASCGVVLR